MLLIKDVLDDLMPEVETFEIREIEEEEGPSYMPRKDDNEGGNDDDDERTKVSPDNQSEHQAILQVQRLAPIQIEESNPKGEHREETTSTMKEDEVQSLSTSSSTIASFIY